jgi:hypothetical protein
MPVGLPIDHEHPLNATMAAYTQHVIIATGKRDWSSRIEDDGVGESWGALGRGLKGLMGRGGRFSDVRSPRSLREYVYSVETMDC